MKKIPQKLMKGISLLEVLLSLSIIAIILVMATRYFFVASNNNKVNTVRQEIGSLIAGITSWKNENPLYSPSLTIQALYNAGFLANSNSLSTDKSILYDPWGGTINLAVAQDTGATISDTLPTAAECTSLLNSYPDGNCGGGNTFSITIN